MFKKTGPNSVESEEGYSVRQISKDFIEYKSKNKVLLVSVEIGQSLGVYASLIEKWEQPFNKYLSKEEKKEVTRHLQQALDFLKIKYEIE